MLNKICIVQQVRHIIKNEIFTSKSLSKLMIYDKKSILNNHPLPASQMQAPKANLNTKAHPSIFSYNPVNKTLPNLAD